MNYSPSIFSLGVAGAKDTLMSRRQREKDKQLAQSGDISKPLALAAKDTGVVKQPPTENAMMPETVLGRRLKKTEDRLKPTRGNNSFVRGVPSVG